MIYTTKHPGMIDGGLNIATKILCKNNLMLEARTLLLFVPTFEKLTFDLKFMSVRKIGSGGESLVFSILASVLSGQR